jgi:dTDP-glucose 4,6-dehydratase
MRWMVTGGAGFIGSAFVRRAIALGWADEIIVFDALTYSGNMENLAPIEGIGNWSFVRGDICQVAEVQEALGDGVDAIFHFAAESHVDRSIAAASGFVHTNVQGTQVLLDCARACGVGRFVHVSTDEVYGSLELDSPLRFTESMPLEPTSPYAASKACSDLMVLAAHRTHKLDCVITRCSNNYGPYQYPEKFIPLFITRAMRHEHLPLYGDGRNVRDWIWVDDHVDGIHAAFLRGKSGAVYNLGGNCERSNKDIATAIVGHTGVPMSLIEPVSDRLAHDRRYAIDPSYASQELGFVAGPPIEERLPELIAWYQANTAWWEKVAQEAHQLVAPKKQPVPQEQLRAL